MMSDGGTSPLSVTDPHNNPNPRGRGLVFRLSLERCSVANNTGDISTSTTAVPLPDVTERPPLRGRLAVYTDYTEITRDNVIDALDKALPAFHVNSYQANYLWNYFRGQQPVLHRQKDVRPEIKKNTVENHAQEITAFKIGYQLAEPLQYTCRMQGSGENGYDELLEHVNELNTLMFAEDKASCDRDLFEWMVVCGVGYRLCEADKSDDVEDGGAPFEIYTLDPRRTCVVRSGEYHHKVVFSFWVGLDTDKNKIYNVFTNNKFFRIRDKEIIEESEITYGSNPIVEYKLNNARMGVFEPVIPLLDAINDIESNRLEDIEQIVQALMVFMDCDTSSEDYDKMRERGAVKIKSIDPSFKPSIQLLTAPLDQTGTQTVKEDLYQSVVNICGMPNRNGQGGSTSDTGAAVLLRDGWTLAESHAKSYELQFKRAERDFLRVALNICKQSKDCTVDLRIRDIELAFNRRNYENIQVKAQVLTTLLSCDKVHPQLAFQACGLFTDPDAAYRQSLEYMEKNKSDLQTAALQVAQQQTAQQVIDEGSQQIAAGSQAATPEPKDGDGVA